MNRIFIAVSFLVFMSLAIFPCRSAAMMEGISTDELTRSSDIVVEGDVIDSRSFWSGDGSTIITRAVILTSDVIRGRLVGRKIVVEYDGGEVVDMGLKISDMATLQKGEKVLLFLRAGNSKLSGKAFRIVGKGQGKYTVGADNIARKRGFSVMKGQELIDNNIPVNILKDKIRRVR